MNWTALAFCNSSLLENGTIVEEPLWNNGPIFHHLCLLLCAIFGGISVIIAFVLIFQHATHYLKPFEQRQIIRILLMIPIYSIVSFLSYLFYRRAVYFEVIRDCYEAFAIASFFTLLCYYVAPTLHDQKDYFRTLKPLNWFWGVFGLQACTGGQNKGPFRKPRSGLTWFNVIWVGIFQYCFIRVFFTIVSVITQVLGRYCEESNSPAFAHIWVTAFECVSVFIAMFCLIQFYLQLRIDLAEHRPFLKVLCIKLVIFFSFWQTEVISLISSGKGPLQPSPKIAYQDIKVGLPNVLLCIEMAIFAVLHIFAFPVRPYTKHAYEDPINEPGSGYSGDTLKYKGGPLGLYALLDAFNPWDIIKASARGFRWLFIGRKHREEDISYQNSAKINDSTAYVGPTYAGTGENATELRPSDDGGLRHGRSDTLAGDVAEDDRAGLLRHSANLATTTTETSPYRTYTNDEDASGDDSGHEHGAPHRIRPAESNGSSGDAPGGSAPLPPPPPPPPGGERPYACHMFGPWTQSRHGPAEHPALREEQQPWDHWGGATTAASEGNGAESTRPPTYQTYDRHG